MLRPATPLTVLLFIAFVLLLLSVLSTPIVKSIPLATYKDVDYGVFGYCKNGPGGKCEGIRIGYATGTFYWKISLLVNHPRRQKITSDVYWIWDNPTLTARV